MSNLSIKINLTKLKNTKLINLTGKSGAVKECIVIPVKDAGLFKGEKGVYLNITAVEIREPKYEETHLLKRSIDKEEYNAMTQEQKDAEQVIGGLKPFKTTEMQADTTTVLEPEPGSDLPF